MLRWTSEDAVDSYDKVLEITGEITGEIIAPNAEGVDEEGPPLCQWSRRICIRNQTKPGRNGESRFERYDHATVNSAV